MLKLTIILLLDYVLVFVDVNDRTTMKDYAYDMEGIFKCSLFNQYNSFVLKVPYSLFGYLIICLRNGDKGLHIVIKKIFFLG